MKKMFSIISLTLTLSLFIFPVFSLSLFSQNNIKYNGKIEKVRVFFNQAQVEKSLNIDLKKGNNEVILVGNSQYINTQSLQFLTSGDYIIMDFSPYIQYVEPAKPTEEKLPILSRKKLKTLRDSLEITKSYYLELKTFISILEQEKNAISSMRVITQPQNIDSLAKLKDGLEYYRSKMLEVTSLLQKTNKDIDIISKRVNEINNDINLILQGDEIQEKRRNEYYIKLNIYAENPIPKASLNYSYLVGNVSWQPIYDLKFTKADEPARFILKADITQNTEENWNNVKLVFSTEQPSLRKSLGILYPYYLNPNPPSQIMRSAGSKSYRMDDAMELTSIESSIQAKSFNNSAYTHLTTTQLTMLGKEYEVGMRHSIESNSKQKTIPLETKKTKADYKHYSIPKLEKSVYISALLPSWEELEIMDANAKIYLENNYINDTYLSSTSTKDTLNLSIGQDKRVAVDRKVNKSKPEKANLMGSQMETIVSIEVIIKNNNQNSIDLNLDDQIPLSNKEDIKISVNNLEGGIYDIKTGKITWDLNLKSLESKTITFSYIVRYPKGINLFLN